MKYQVVSKPIANTRDWHDWYAWHPVWETEYNQYTRQTIRTFFWLEHIERKEGAAPTGDRWTYYYREKQK